MERKESSNQSIDRAFMLLEKLSKYKDGLGVTELSEMALLPKSTTYRILSSLSINGYVRKDPMTERYKLSYMILQLAGRVLENTDIRSVARPFLEKLSENTGLTVHLAIMENEVAFYIDKVESTASNIRMYSSIGREIPLYCTGVGKVLLSHLDFKDVKRLVPEKDMIKFTDKTITSHEHLLKELVDIRKKGYGLDEIEHEEDIRCIAAPIFNATGQVVASISLTGFIKHLSLERLPELIPVVTDITKEISKELGYQR